MPLGWLPLARAPGATAVRHDRPVVEHLNESAATIDWDPRSPAVLADQIASYDAMRARCPVAHGTQGNWTVFGHADTVRILEDPETFSNVVSSHVAVPNGMDPPQHTVYRAVVDGFFRPAAITAFEPTCRRIIEEHVAAFRPPRDVELMSEMAEPLANALACAFMGWPDSLHGPLREWTRRNHAATRSMDREAMSHVALEFDGYIRDQLELRRAAGPDAPDDVTTALLRETVDGRPLGDAEIVAIVRNWTVGDLGTIAASMGIVVEFLARRPDVVADLRRRPEAIVSATDEILRIHAPLVANRRRTTRAVTIGGREIPEGERVIVLWASANRDERVFGDPDAFRLDRDPDANLLYGRGIHDCPGAPLARLELGLFVAALLDLPGAVRLRPGGRRDLASYPGSGFSALDVTLG